MIIACPVCQQKVEKRNAEVHRAEKSGLRIFCGRVCAGIGRRDTRTKEEKVEAKRLYDLEYRAKNRNMLKAKKHAYHKKTYDPKKAAAERQKNMARHVRYCQRPEYKAYKHDYDRRHRAQKEFGEFWECAILAIDIDREVMSRATRYDIYTLNGTLNKRLQRRREYERLISNKS